MPRGSEGLKAEQLKYRADEDIHAGAESVHAEEAVAAGTVGLREVVKGRHQQFYRRLELAGNHLEAGYGKNADQQRREQEASRNDHRGDHRRGDAHQPEEAASVLLMENGVAHHYLDCFALFRRRHDERADEENKSDDQPNNKEARLFFLSHVFITFIFLRSATAKPSKTGCRDISLQPGKILPATASKYIHKRIKNQVSQQRFCSVLYKINELLRP